MAMIFLRFTGLLNLGMDCARKYPLTVPLCLAELLQGHEVMVGQFRAGFALQRLPVAIGGQGNLFIRHFHEEQIGQLFDVIAVINAIMAGCK